MGGVIIVHMLASSAVDQEFEPRPRQTKDYYIDISFILSPGRVKLKTITLISASYLYSKLAVFESKRTDWLTVNLDSMSVCSDMSTHGLLF